LAGTKAQPFLFAHISKAVLAIPSALNPLNGIEMENAVIEQCGFNKGLESALVAAGYKISERDPKVKPEFPGAFMVTDPRDDEDGFCLVGDDRSELIVDAYASLMHIIGPKAHEKPVAARVDLAIEAYGPIGDLTATLQAAYDGGADGDYQVIVTRSPSFMVIFKRSVANDAEYVSKRIGFSDLSAEDAAMQQLADELVEGGLAEIGMPIVEDLRNSCAHCFDYGNGAFEALATFTPDESHSG
jgi:hypothetical protein